MKIKVAIILTCFNRSDFTLKCLSSFYNSVLEHSIFEFDVFLVDDCSTDGTSTNVNNSFPEVNIILSSGELFWAGGMRLAWQTAINTKKYDSFLLLNDDVVLEKKFVNNLLIADLYSRETKGKGGIYCGATIDKISGEITYGGHKIINNHFIMKSIKLNPTDKPQQCDLTNANILWVCSNVVDEIGIFDTKFTHGIADYDYSLRAIKKGIPVYLAPNICGYCTNDHKENWLSKDKSSLKKRIEYLKGNKGLAQKEYLFYIKRHFPLYLPYSWLMQWIKTFFPYFWELKKKN